MRRPGEGQEKVKLWRSATARRLRNAVPKEKQDVDRAAEDALTVGAVLLCPCCNANFPPSEENFALYLSADGVLSCPSCEEKLDWWNLLVTALSDGFLGLQYAPIRSQSTIANVVMTPNSQTTIRPTQFGVPKTARILDMHFTGGEREPPEAKGTFLPLEVKTNPSERRVLADQPLTLFPMPVGESPPLRQVVSVLINWVDKAAMDGADASLLAAVEAFNEKRHLDALVSAAAAVEVSVSPTLSAFLEQFSSSEATSQLLRRAGADGKLDVLLPAVCRIVGAPVLPDAPAKALRGLRKLRNRAAHDGRLGQGASRKQIAEAVSGAIFCVEHARIASRMVDDHFKVMQPPPQT